MKKDRVDNIRTVFINEEKKIQQRKVTNKKIQQQMRNNLSDSYIKSMLIKRSSNILNTQDIPPELIELKRRSMQLKRTIKQTKND